MLNNEQTICMFFGRNFFLNFFIHNNLERFLQMNPKTAKLGAISEERPHPNLLQIVLAAAKMHFPQ